MIHNVEELANAIIVRAAKDYRKALKRSLCFPNSNSVKNEIRKLEAFFQSDYYKLMTNLDGDMLMQRLRQEVLG